MSFTPSSSESPTSITSPPNAVRQQRKRKEITDPTISDPAERKRVLNVLAQRQRKREQQAQFENILSSLQPDNATEGQCPLNESFGAYTGDLPTPPLDQCVPTAGQPSSDQLWLNQDESFTQLDETIATLILPETEGTTPDLWEDLERVCSDHVQFPGPNDPFPPLPTPQNPTRCISPARLTQTTSTLSQPLFPFPFPSPVRYPSPTTDLSLCVPEMTLLRASHLLATRLHSLSLIWSPTSSSIFTATDSNPTPAPPWISTLPPNLRPTPTQLTTPHHPLLDLLPWPRVRSKLIATFALPPSQWPRDARGEKLGLLQLVYDLEDGGVRVWGADPAVEEAWEVRDGFVERWWWCLDGAVLRAADVRRRERGEAGLRIERLLTAGGGE
ncbi:hypothetical protein M8818_006555 [Zalaria obscura]|uniref:Uncharacterized protein n=1 Tax=Zalaria obscura TaxID=2024903 RepID=A0ACC3S7Y3_9PEZI